MGFQMAQIQFNTEEYDINAFQTSQLSSKEQKSISSPHLLDTCVESPKQRDSLQLDIDRYEVSKPSLQSLAETKQNKTSDVDIIIRLMDMSQKLVEDDRKLTELKIAARGQKLDENKQQINEIARKEHDLEKAQQNWDWRKSVATNLLNLITAGAGVGLLYCGEPITGTSMLVSGGGGLISSALEFFGVDKSITNPLRAGTTIAGALGSIGGILYNPSQVVNNMINGAQFVTGFISSMFSGYANYAQTKNQAQAANYDSMHTEKENQRRLLDEKMSSSITSHRAVVTPTSNILKTLVKSQHRINLAMENMIRGQFV